MEIRWMNVVMQILGLLFTCVMLAVVIRVRQGIDIATLIDHPSLLWRDFISW